ncbi:DUF4198 domain-containing protein [Shewanella psychropiezotolerans]|uniref:DUF4198 domain-containing protein n=1 Tax=Shewanella psychropiezotolerans TaxID=2593655 RepID=A0ABX5WYT6_9GAMM|nr:MULTISPECIES: DUF4198 domain-containing protein [Shewanella]MPY24623.1 DUF4198 domain-containing protein [Shewanella sp. YLB-07]QDO83956.1 DUF4198 domain-containing protein [Shewanella psychropiezotolerans]
MKKTLLVTASLTLVSTLLSPFASHTAQAHDRWILPSHFNVSADAGKGVWITSDVSASNQVFIYDKPFGSEDVQVVMPDGKLDSPSSSYRGGRKSVFDYQLAQDGTYRFEKKAKPKYYSRYKVKGQDKPVRLAMDKQAAAAAMPKGAYELQGAMYFSRVETYVTLNKPNDVAYQAKNEYLELLPVTHPANIIENEVTEMNFLFHGKPVEGVTVSVVKSGTLYRNKIDAIELVSNKAGSISFTPPSAGLYLLHASFEQKNTDTRLADKSVNEIFLTFEAGLE